MEFIPKRTKIVKKHDLSRPKPSHVPSREFIEKALEEEPQLLQAVVVDYFMRQGSLPQGVDRNVIAADFNDYDQLVIQFDTGEKIKTKSIDIKQIIESHVGGFREKIILGEGVTHIPEIFINSTGIVPYAALNFASITVDGQTVYKMQLNVPD